MFFSNWRWDRKLDKYCLQRFYAEQNNIRCMDLKEIKEFGEPPNELCYTGQLGLFTEDMFYINIIDLVWYCRSDGEIYEKWFLRAKFKSKLWQDEVDQKRINPQSIDSIIKVPMSFKSSSAVSEYTKEMWTMHKLSSDTLL